MIGYYPGTEEAHTNPTAPARGVPQSPRWRVGLVCAKDAKLSCRGNILAPGKSYNPLLQPCRQAGRSGRGNLGRTKAETGDGQRPAASQVREGGICTVAVLRGTLRRPGWRIGQRGDATRAPTQEPRPERAARCRPVFPFRDWYETGKSTSLNTEIPFRAEPFQLRLPMNPIRTLANLYGCIAYAIGPERWTPLLTQRVLCSVRTKEKKIALTFAPGF